MFIAMLFYKAASAGRQVIQVDPRGHRADVHMRSARAQDPCGSLARLPRLRIVG